MTTLGTWDGWNEMKAEERVFEDDAAGEKIRELKAGLVGLREVTTWNAFVIRERFFGDSSWCERCDEQFPDILMFTFDEDDPCVESAVLDDLGIENEICAMCVAAHKEPTCENCGVQESYLAWRDNKDKSCSRWIGDEQVVFEEHSFISFEQRQAQATKVSQ
jgi:hypothetical protein